LAGSFQSALEGSREVSRAAAASLVGPEQLRLGERALTAVQATRATIPTRAFMDHVLEWRLIHRTEEDLDRLYKASAFGRGCTRVVFEEQGINLFAECVKP
jgi:hypothetical protein